ncbi:7-cyano-7-deazaguanine synthase QueC [Parvularcula sp. IMCC14364]|uniref:7-cyano-7-deazaguanine synthase QueC n=1 Tax=Parvularcula sp. IMCC14364 TaxID=3067902 RepID=UPI00274148CA|nr:7-cyano-7-deazaguanine synthase QueC [Parvularcula sp. IMCC14364]
MKLDQAKTLVLFSGGQDSATCLAWSLARYKYVETIGFDYGQRHDVELVARQRVRGAIQEQFPAWRDRLGPDHLLDLSFLSAIGETGMTADIEIMTTEAGLPNTFVPGRNLAFLTAAAALAYRRDLGVLVGGMCQTDYSGYPDCRDDTLQAQMHALNLGMETDLSLQTPLMYLTKAESWHLAEELGGQKLIEIMLEETHTCYLGDRSVRYEYGYGCGTCPACSLREKGWLQYRAA